MPHPPNLILNRTSLSLVFWAVVTVACGQEDSDDVLATYRGGTVTRGEVAEAEQSLASSDLPALASRKIRAIAMMEYLGQNDESDASDLVLEMKIKSARASILSKSFIRDLAETCEIPEEELEKRFIENRENFRKPEKRRIRHIFKSTRDLDQGEAEERRQQMKSIRRELAEGAAFEEFASKESEAKTRFDGGKIGNVIRGQMAPEIEEVVFALNEDEISTVLEFGEGLHIFWCEGIVPPKKPSDAEIRDRIRDFYRQSTFRERWKSLQEDWLKEARIDFETIRSEDAETSAVEVLPGVGFSGQEIRALLQMPLEDEELSEAAVRKALGSFIVNTRAMTEFLEEGELSADMEKMLEWKLRKLRADHAFKQRVEAKAKVSSPTEKEMRELYEENKINLVTDRQFLVESIAVRVGPETAMEDTKSMEKLRSALVEESELGILEAAESHLPAAVRERSQINLPTWKPAAAFRSGGQAAVKVLQDLEPGQTSPVFRTTFGNPMLRIVRLHKIEEPRPLTFEESKTGLETFLRKKRIEALRLEAENALLEEMEFQLSD